MGEPEQKAAPQGCLHRSQPCCLLWGDLLRVALGVTSTGAARRFICLASCFWKAFVFSIFDIVFSCRNVIGKSAVGQSKFLGCFARGVAFHSLEIV